ncbi:MAG: ATP-dependent 6-phosphofructokinase [Bacilli bacterium]
MKMAVLTSGGDSPGMNACLRAIVRKALHDEYEIYGVYEGFYGLCNNKIRSLTRKNVAEIINRGGTILKSARFPEFCDERYAKIAAKNLQILGIDVLFVIGGNGSYQGGMLLSKLGVKVINIPGTIDNDILGTDYTIGYDTAINTAVEAIDKIRDTSTSHRRASVIEVMGRYNGDIALSSGLACGAEVVITCETGFDKNKFIKMLTATENKHKSHSIVILSENFMNINLLGDIITENTNMKVNKVTLGHIQRGGVPSAYDRRIATAMGHYAVELYQSNIYNVCVSIICGEVNYVDFEAYKLKTNDEDLVRKQHINKIIDDVR